MKTISIVSSFSESCGNAAFTKVISDGLQRFHGFKVQVAELDLNLTQSLDSRLRRKADRHIKNLSNLLAKADLVNIQLEAGLYGSYPQDIYKRILWLINANKNTSVTLHSPRLMSGSTSDKRAALKMILSGHPLSGIKKYIGTFYSDVHVTLNRKLISLFAKNNIPLIVHTLRAKKQISELYNYHNVTVHPLKFIDKDFVPNVQAVKDVRSKLGVKDGDVTIALFGYISAYKGHLEALQAMRLLPSNYKLFIYGRQHPQTLKMNGKVDDYLGNLIHHIDVFKISHRVFFMGELDDNDFLNAAASVDICWLPYYENGQDGSGIASICFDVSPRILCSMSFAFDELLKLIPYENCKRFDIGNYYEMASKTQLFMKESQDSNKKYSFAKYTIESQSAVYANVCSNGK